jgi:hypothetical protein
VKGNRVTSPPLKEYSVQVRTVSMGRIITEPSPGEDRINTRAS